MPTPANTPPKPTRAQRWRRRLPRIALWSGMGAVVLVFALAWTAQTEWFWRQFVFGAAFGPYWDTALTWKEFEATLMPPGFSARGVELREPGGAAVVTAERLDIGIGPKLWKSEKDIQRLAIRDLKFDIRLGENSTNLERAVARLTEGLPPSPRSAAPAIPEIKLSHIWFRGLRIRIRDDRPGSTPKDISFDSKDPVRVLVDRASRSFTPGRIDDFLAVGAQGALRATVGEASIGGWTELEFKLPELKLLPANRAEGRATLFDKRDGIPLVDISAEVPLLRALDRPKATPFENVRIALRDPAGGASAATAGLSFDPLEGAFAAEFDIAAGWGPIRDGLRRVFRGKSQRALDEFFARPTFATLLGEESRDVPLRIRGKASGRGLMPYAREAWEPHAPLSVESEGLLSVDGIGPRTMALLRGLAGIYGLTQDASDVLSIDAQHAWRFSADESKQLGELWMQTFAWLSPPNQDDLLYEIAYSDFSDKSLPIRFNPFAPPDPNRCDAWDDAATTSTLNYVAFPGYEDKLRLASAQLTAGLRLIDALDVQSARVHHRLNVRESGAMRALLDPVLSRALAAAKGRAEAILTNPGNGAPNELEAIVALEDIRLEGIPELIRFRGEAKLFQQDTMLAFRDMTLRLQRQEGEAGAMEFALGLANGPKNLPSYIDLVSGVGHLEVLVSTIRREIVEVLLRVQTFGLSRKLAEPFYQRILSVLGFRPGDPDAQGRATIFVSADMGPVLRAFTEFRVNNLPLSKILSDKASLLDESQQVNAGLIQAAKLDRRTGLLYPQRFDLKVSSIARKEPFARLQLLREGDPALDFGVLGSFAERELEELESGEADRRAVLLAFVTGLFDRLARLQSAVRDGGAGLLLELPSMNLAAWGPALREVGYPIEGGRLNVRLSTALGEAGPGGMKADGGFSVDGLQLSGVAQPVPHVEGAFRLGQEGERVIVENISTSLDLDPEFEATSFELGGWFSTESLESSWRIGIARLNSGIFAVLQRVRAAGIGGATAILQNLPVARLLEVAAPGSRVDLAFELDSDTTADNIALRAVQSGDSIVFLRDLFRPLSFRLEQQLALSGGTQFLLKELAGRILEEGEAEPLLQFDLSEPVAIGDASAGGNSVLLIEARKDLAAQRGFRVPGLDRAIDAGTLDARVEVRFPKGNIDLGGGRLSLDNAFDLALDGVQLSGVAHTFGGRATGVLRKEQERIRLEDLRITSEADGVEAGTVRLGADLDVQSRTYDATIAIEDVRGALMQALPEGIAKWASENESRASFFARAIGDFDLRTAGLDVIARVRGLALPPVPLPSGAEYRHPPLDGDFDLSLDVDRDTSSVLVQHLRAAVADGDGDNATAIPAARPAILRAETVAPFSVDLETMRLATPNLPEGGIAITGGPIAVEPFTPVLAEFTSIPLSAGTVTLSGRVMAAETELDQENRFEGRMLLAGGRWDGSPGPTQFDAAATATAAQDANGFRIDDASVRLDYADGSFDHLGVRGDWERELSGNYLNVTLLSDALQLDRIFRFVGDWQSRQASPAPAGTEVASPRRAIRDYVPDGLEARIGGELRNLRFLEVGVPSVSARAVVRNDVATLSRFDSELDEGRVALSGKFDFSADLPVWDGELEIEGLQARPFVNSFGPPALRDQYEGRLSTRLSLRGAGLTGEDLRRELRAAATVSVRDLRVSGKLLQQVAGSRDPVDADGTALIAGNRALMRVETPWNASRDFFLQAIVRNVFPGAGEERWLSALVDFSRTTTVGPPGRNVRESAAGAPHPLRQKLAGIRLRADGPLERDGALQVKVESVEY